VFQHPVDQSICLHVDGFRHPHVACSLNAHLSFSVPFGQALWVQGANGAGKTTLLMCLVGICTNFYGSIHGPSAFYCGHLNGLKDDQTVFKNLKFRAQFMGGDFETIDKALGAFDSIHLKHLLVGQLSQGQKRKIALCSALLSPHKLWVLDEPLTNLDKTGVGQFQAIGQDHLNRGGAIVLASHHNPFEKGEGKGRLATPPLQPLFLPPVKY
jgi:heme exporter protein A